jgi:putative flippase GtrA
MTPALLSDPFFRFMLVGGVAAIVNILARIIINLETLYEAAIALAFPIALTTAFVLNRAYVFHAANGAVARQYFRFTLVNLVALAPVWIISFGLARWFFPLIGFEWHAYTVAHTIGVLSLVAASYLWHKLFTFAPSGPNQP